MSQLNIAVLILIGCFCWLAIRSLRNYPISLRMITSGAAAVIFLRPIIGEGTFTGTGLLFQIAIISLAFSYFVYLKLNGSSVFICEPIDKSFIIFLAFLSLSLLFSINTKASADQIVYFLSIYLLFWTIKNFPSEKRIKMLLLTSLCLACFILLIYAVYQYSFGFSAMREFLKTNPEYFINSPEFIKRLNQNIIFATFIYPPAFGGYLSMLFMVLIGIYFAIDTKTLKSKRRATALKLVILTVCLLIVPVLILTKSKGALLSLLFGAAVFFALSKKRSRLTWLVLTIFAVTAITGGLSFLPLDGRMPKLVNFIRSYQVRIEYWRAAGMMILKRPVFGFGPGTFGIAYPLFKTLLGEETIMAHNSFIQIWTESGAFSFSAFLIFCFIFIKKGLKNNIRDKSIQIGLYSASVSFLIHNLVDFGVFDPQRAVTAFSIMGIFFMGEKKTGERTIPNRKKQIIRLSVGILLFFCVLLYSLAAYSAALLDQKAAYAYKQNNLQKAAELSKYAINLSRLSDVLYFHRAIIFEKAFLKSNREKKALLNEAINNYQKATSLNPFVAHYHWRLAKALLVSNRKDAQKKAEEQFKKAVLLYPVNPFYYEQLADFYDIIGDNGKAEKSRKQAKILQKYYTRGTR